MKHFIVVLCTALASLNINAQITTTTNQALTIHDNLNNKEYSLRNGTTVTIHGFKKKNGLYHFAIVADEFAQVFNYSKIPFNIDEKQLKKLPNAQSDNIRSFISQKHDEIITAIKKRYKQEALDGKIIFIVKNDYHFSITEDSFGHIQKGDTLYIIGYSQKYSDYKFAIYSKNAVGIFKTTSLNQDLKNQLNIEYLPSIEDNDVLITLKQKKEEIYEQYRKYALAGNVKGIIAGSFLTDNNHSSPFSYGDTVSIVGYSEKDNAHWFAMYSQKGIGIYHTAHKISAFKNENDIKLDLLPSVDSPEVKDALSKQEKIIDSLLVIERDSILRVLDESKERLLAFYKEYSPILITDVTWSANSVGGIEVALEVTNCSLETIKYISFQGYFRNAVGDKCLNEIGGGTVWKARGIGPIGPRPTSLENFKQRYIECKGGYNFDNLLFYSRTANSFTLSSVTIQYMNGKTITLSGSNLNKHIRYRDPL